MAKATNTKDSSPKGTLLKVCAGWKIYKIMLPNGRMEYNAIIDKDTEANKRKWATIKNNVYIRTGFKGGRFGTFSKYGQANDEPAFLDMFCDEIRKYYKNKVQYLQLGDRFINYTDNKVYEVTETDNDYATTKELVSKYKVKYLWEFVEQGVERGNYKKLDFDVKDTFKIKGVQEEYYISDIDYENMSVGYSPINYNSRKFLRLVDVISNFENGTWKKMDIEQYKVGDRFYEPETKNEYVVRLLDRDTIITYLGADMPFRFTKKELDKRLKDKKWVRINEKLYSEGDKFYSDELPQEIYTIVKINDGDVSVLETSSGNGVSFANEQIVEYIIEKDWVKIPFKFGDEFIVPKSDTPSEKRKIGRINVDETTIYYKGTAEVEIPTKVAIAKVNDGIWVIVSKDKDEENDFPYNVGDIFYRKDKKSIFEITSIDDEEIYIKYGNGSINIIYKILFLKDFIENGSYNKLNFSIGDTYLYVEGQEKYTINRIGTLFPKSKGYHVYTRIWSNNADFTFTLDSVIDFIDQGLWVKEDSEEAKKPYKIGDRIYQKDLNRLFIITKLDYKEVKTKDQNGLENTWQIYSLEKYIREGYWEIVPFKEGDIMTTKKETKDLSDDKKFKIDEVGLDVWTSPLKNRNQANFKIDKAIEFVKQGKWRIIGNVKTYISKEQIEDMIAGLEVLAEAGDKKAQSMIDGLRVMLIS